MAWEETRVARAAQKPLQFTVMLLIIATLYGVGALVALGLVELIGLLLGR